MLKALFRYLWPAEPEKSQPRAEQLSLDLVTRAEFDAAIQKIEQRVEWDLSEWYDKFSTLHARAAKRVQSQGKHDHGVRQEQQAEPTGPASILHHRRKPWSV